MQIPEEIKYGISRIKSYTKAFVPIKLRYGKDFCYYRKLLEESQWWSKEKMEEFQFVQLKNLLTHCARNVPYYREEFQNIGFLPESDFKTFDDLRRIPYLTKEMVLKSTSKLIAQNYKRYPPVETFTGGSTGKPLKFLRSKRCAQLGMALHWRAWNWAGYHFGMKCVTLTEAFEKKRGELEKLKAFVYDPSIRTWHLNISDLSNDKLDQFCSLLKDIRPQVIQSFPSTLFLLAMWVKKKGLNVIRPKVILSLSEQLYPKQRELIEEVFDTKIFDWYGCWEHVVSAAQCEKGGYHLNLEMGFMEVLGKGDKPNGFGKTGQVVATGFENYAMPFVRYRLGDFMRFKSNSCACGRTLPLIEIVGAENKDLIVTTNKDYVWIPTEIVFGYYWQQLKIEGIQFIQNDLSSLKVRLVKGENFEEADLVSLSKAIQDWVGKDMQIEFEFTQQIPRTSDGKYRFVISTIFADTVNTLIDN